MGGRYSLFVLPEDVEERFGVALPGDVEPTYTAAPGQRLSVVANRDPDVAVRQEWGFVPAWAGDGFSGLINARAETAGEKPAFREAYERRRCYVLADGFYEWAETDGGKRPYRVEFADRRPFAMAGLWARRTPDTTQGRLGDFGGSADRAGEPDPDLLRTRAGDDLRVYPVSSRVNSPANDDPGLVEPVEG